MDDCNGCNEIHKKGMDVRSMTLIPGHQNLVDVWAKFKEIHSEISRSQEWDVGAYTDGRKQNDSVTAIAGVEAIATTTTKGRQVKSQPRTKAELKYHANLAMWMKRRRQWRHRINQIPHQTLIYILVFLWGFCKVHAWLYSLGISWVDKQTLGPCHSPTNNKQFEVVETSSLYTDQALKSWTVLEALDTGRPSLRFWIMMN